MKQRPETFQHSKHFSPLGSSLRVLLLRCFSVLKIENCELKDTNIKMVNISHRLEKLCGPSHPRPLWGNFLPQLGSPQHQSCTASAVEWGGVLKTHLILIFWSIFTTLKECSPTSWCSGRSACFSIWKFEFRPTKSVKNEKLGHISLTSWNREVFK